MSTLTWADLMANPHLKDLPFKIELNKWGRIEMDPVTDEHGMVRADIAMELGRRAAGQVVLGCAIASAGGVHVADVAWVSRARLREFGAATPYPRAPEICVEVRLPSDTWGDMQMRARLFLGAGAEEVWIAELGGERRVVRS